MEQFSTNVTSVLFHDTSVSIGSMKSCVSKGSEKVIPGIDMFLEEKN